MPFESVARRQGAIPSHEPNRDAVVQRKPALRGMDIDAQSAALSPQADAEAPKAARDGTAGAGKALPHHAAIQKAFGHHDLSGVRAHTDDKAKAASQDIGAEAFAYGSDIAFDRAPDLRTAAHEAAHVVQQRGGVSLGGDVGKAGNSHEQHADAVADAVAGGRSAEGLLDRYGAGGAAKGGVVQRKVVQRKPKEKKPEERLTRYSPESGLKVNVGKVLSMRNEWYDAAIKLLRDGLANKAQTLDVKKRLEVEHLIVALTQQKSSGSELDPNKNVIKPEELQGIFDDGMPGRLTVMVSNVLGMPEDGTVQQMRESYIRIKNSQPWSTIQRTIAMRNNGGAGTTNVTSTITPVNQSFHDTYHGTHGVVGKQFGHSGLGSMSPRLDAKTRNHITETRRPTNLWHTKLEDDEGQLLFEAFRSGAFSDVAIKDPGQQAEVGQAKAKQVLEAMLIHRLKQVNDPVELRQYLKGEKTFSATVVSMNLLTEAKALGFGDKEAARQHHAAIGAVSGQDLQFDIKFQIPGKSLKAYSPKANFRVLDFGTGVNVASGKIGFGGATVNQRKRNKEPMKELMKDYGEWRDKIGLKIKSLQEDWSPEGFRERSAEAKKLSMDLKQAQALVEEIEKKGTGHVGDYKLPQLLANLAHMMGHLVHFNCKSGKDRTGIMDAKSKHLAYELHDQRKSGGDLSQLPQLSRRDDDQEFRHQQMLWESGNLQVLEKNVGGQSLKVADLAGVPIRNKDSRLRHDLGGEDRLREMQGLKRYTNIDHGMKPGKRGMTGKPKESSAVKERVKALEEMKVMMERSRNAFHLAKLNNTPI